MRTSIGKVEERAVTDPDTGTHNDRVPIWWVWSFTTIGSIDTVSMELGASVHRGVAKETMANALIMAGSGVNIRFGWLMADSYNEAIMKVERDIMKPEREYFWE